MTFPYRVYNTRRYPTMRAFRWVAFRIGKYAAIPLHYLGPFVIVKLRRMGHWQ